MQANARRIQQTSQSREKSHTWRGRERTSRKWQSLEERGELTQFQQETLELRYVSEDFQSPPEEGDFVLDGRTLVKWTRHCSRSGWEQQYSLTIWGRWSWAKQHSLAISHTPTFWFNFPFTNTVSPPGFSSLNGLSPTPTYRFVRLKWDKPFHSQLYYVSVCYMYYLAFLALQAQTSAAPSWGPSELLPEAKQVNARSPTQPGKGGRAVYLHF